MSKKIEVSDFLYDCLKYLKEKYKYKDMNELLSHLLVD